MTCLGAVRTVEDDMRGDEGMHPSFARMNRRLLLGRERRAAAQGPKSGAGEITIRPSTPEDSAAIERLAELDGRPPTSGDFILAIVGGELWAALSLDGGDVIADPFRPTADVVALLRVRHVALHDAGAGRGRAPSLHHRSTSRALGVRGA
jgi:hypothetical protein